MFETNTAPYENAALGYPIVYSSSGLYQNQHPLTDYTSFENRKETISSTFGGSLHAHLRLFYLSQSRATISFSLGKPERWFEVTSSAILDLRLKIIEKYYQKMANLT